MKSSKRKICQVLALVVSGMGASLAMAAGPVIQGGGSSLVAPTIGANSPASGEIGLYGTANATFTYYSVGSGAGQNAFLNNQPTFFGAGVTGTVHFANSDAALATTQISTYKAGLGTTNGPLIQIPYIVTPITVPVVNGPAVTSTTTPQTTPGQAHSIALNDDDLCGIFSGKLTNWSQGHQPGNERGLYDERTDQGHLSLGRQRHDRTADPPSGCCLYDRQHGLGRIVRRFADVHGFVPGRRAGELHGGLG